MSSKHGKEERLAESQDMEPIAGTVDVDVPADVLWKCFDQGNLWPRWNRCFFWVKNKRLELGRQLIWVFQPIRWWYLYKMFAIAKIVELEAGKKVTWAVTALPGFYARHTYSVEDLGEGRSRFGSWEKVYGWSFRWMKLFWIAHFTFVKDRSLEGAQALEKIYRRDGKIEAGNVPRRSYLLFSLVVMLLVGVLLAGGWFYTSFVHQSDTELAAGVYAVLGGGSNSLVVTDGDEVLVVDPKFPPGSKTLRRWLEKHDATPVTHVVNTHYHYDHTQGNPLYPEARIYAYQNVPEFMRADDPDFWAKNADGIPDTLIRGDVETIRVGRYTVELHHSEPSHTHGDLWLRLPELNVVATGDVVFHTYYPFLDLAPERGARIPGMIRTVRGLAESYPDATFVPGHGPLATADELLGYADYLEHLWGSVEQAIAEGKSEAETVSTVDRGDWNLSILPSFHNTLLPEWATAKHNVRWVYQMQIRKL